MPTGDDLTLALSPTAEMVTDMQALLKTGLYGRTLSDVAERLICAQLVEIADDKPFLLEGVVARVGFRQ